ncbi:MAG: hypothetical protein WD425_16635 [Nitrospirales bacterium]
MMTANPNSIKHDEGNRAEEKDEDVRIKQHSATSGLGRYTDPWGPSILIEGLLHSGIASIEKVPLLASKHQIPFLQKTISFCKIWKNSGDDSADFMKA